jgi:hypothetical protein
MHLGTKREIHRVLGHTAVELSADQIMRVIFTYSKVLKGWH